jgi:hypothetical protein
MIKQNNIDIKEWKKQNRACHRWLRIPGEWYNFFNNDDFEWVVKAYHDLVNGPKKGHDRLLDWRSSLAAQSSKHIRSNFRKVLRARRNAGFGPGMYIVRTSNSWFDPAIGKYCRPEWGSTSHSMKTRPRKGSFLMWVATDELGRAIFMYNNTMWSARGYDLDGLSKI